MNSYLLANSPGYHLTAAGFIFLWNEPYRGADTIVWPLQLRARWLGSRGPGGTQAGLRDR